jgi:hypothetical protein
MRIGIAFMGNRHATDNHIGCLIAAHSVKGDDQRA